MNTTHKKIGIWGLGVVGTSALKYFVSKGEHTLEILDTKKPNQHDQEFLDQNNIPFYLQNSDLMPFLERNDYILPSPGIDLQPYKAYQHKWLSELDIFSSGYTKPIIAITGTVGKTSITHLLGQLLNASGLQTSVGGNIGTGMLDLLTIPSQATLLEVSSFQLELCTTFAPNLAIWTNFYPNHLDRHGDTDSYFNAKYRILAHQHVAQKALLPLALYNQISSQPLQSAVSYFCTHAPTQQERDLCKSANVSLYYIDDSSLSVFQRDTVRTLIDCALLPAISYPENWIIICAALDLLGISLDVITGATQHLTIPEHRLEKIIMPDTGNTIHTIDFYNDSKSTTPQSTLAAVQHLQTPEKLLHLFLGGISKGIDRSGMIPQLKKSIHHIYCFGKEADTLDELCKKWGIPSSKHKTLEDAIDEMKIRIKDPKDHQILFSPAGASFDLFTNYAHRGDVFKRLIHDLYPKIN